MKSERLITCGRLTTESGVPVSTSDKSSQGIIYWTPWLGNLVSLYTGIGNQWEDVEFDELSLALSISQDANYDVFLKKTGLTAALQLSVAWSSDSARAEAVRLQNGRYVKTADPTQLLVGTIRGSASNVVEDSDARRFVANVYNRVLRRLTKANSTQHTYGSATVREWNNGTGGPHRVHLLLPLGNDLATVTVNSAGGAAGGTIRRASIYGGVDSTTATTITTPHDATIASSAGVTQNILPGLGYHFLSVNESANDAGNIEFFNYVLHVGVWI
jgi:hypothetical protein